MQRRSKLENRAHLWAIARHHAEFTAHELSAASGRTVRYVKDALREWIRGGFVERAGRRGNKALYRLARTEADPNRALRCAIPHAGPEDRMWFAMRKCGDAFSARDVAMWSNSAEVPVSVEQAQRYCRVLLATGYLRCTVPADGRGNPALYRLVRNTGPRAPLERRVRAVLDPNRNTVAVVSAAQGDRA